MHQEMELDGATIVITRNRRPERHLFDTAEDARNRLGTIRESLSWVGTPFRDCADTKGRNGGVDCAMLLVRAFVDSGRVPSFDPRPYSNQWHLHQSEEKFLDWIEKKLRCRRVASPRVGDVIIYFWGRCYAHGAIMINKDEIVHAYAQSGWCHVSMISESTLNFMKRGRIRPKLYFEVTDGRP